MRHRQVGRIGLTVTWAREVWITSIFLMSAFPGERTTVADLAVRLQRDAGGPEEIIARQQAEAPLRRSTRSGESVGFEDRSAQGTSSVLGGSRRSLGYVDW
jgi:hypothetical protein